MAEVDKSEKEKLMKEFQSNWKPLEFEIKEIYFIHKSKYEKVYSVKQTIKFTNENL
jgi:hypothetical protein